MKNPFRRKKPSKQPPAMEMDDLAKSALQDEASSSSEGRIQKDKELASKRLKWFAIGFGILAVLIAALALLPLAFPGLLGLQAAILGIGIPALACIGLAIVMLPRFIFGAKGGIKDIKSIAKPVFKALLIAGIGYVASTYLLPLVLPGANFMPAVSLWLAGNGLAFLTPVMPFVPFIMLGVSVLTSLFMSGPTSMLMGKKEKLPVRELVKEAGLVRVAEVLIGLTVLAIALTLLISPPLTAIIVPFVSAGALAPFLPLAMVAGIGITAGPVSSVVKAYKKPEEKPDPAMETNSDLNLLKGENNLVPRPSVTPAPVQQHGNTHADPVPAAIAPPPATR